MTRCAFMDIDDEAFIVKSVIVYLDLFHSSRGDLDVTLIAPDRGGSILHPSPRQKNMVEER